MNRTEALKASPPMFESRWLDACSRVHPSVPVILFAPAIAILMTLGIERVGAVGAVAWALGGYVFWTLTEYWMHRIVFHFEPEDGIGARLHWIIHGVHHDHPNDRMRLVMPPSVSVPLAIAFYVLFLLVLGGTVAPAFGAGFLVGYLIYDMTHYHVHHHTPAHARRARACARPTCAITSRTTRAASASARPGGTTSSARRRSARRGRPGPAPVA